MSKRGSRFIQPVHSDGKATHSQEGQVREDVNKCERIINTSDKAGHLEFQQQIARSDADNGLKESAVTGNHYGDKVVKTQVWKQVQHPSNVSGASKSQLQQDLMIVDGGKQGTQVENHKGVEPLAVKNSFSVLSQAGGTEQDAALQLNAVEGITSASVLDGPALTQSGTATRNAASVAAIELNHVVTGAMDEQFGSPFGAENKQVLCTDDTQPLLANGQTENGVVMEGNFGQTHCIFGQKLQQVGEKMASDPTELRGADGLLLTAPKSLQNERMGEFTDLEENQLGKLQDKILLILLLASK